MPRTRIETSDAQNGITGTRIYLSSFSLTKKKGEYPLKSRSVHLFDYFVPRFYFRRICNAVKSHLAQRCLIFFAMLRGDRESPATATMYPVKGSRSPRHLHVAGITVGDADAEPRTAGSERRHRSAENRRKLRTVNVSQSAILPRRSARNFCHVSRRGFFRRVC